LLDFPPFFGFDDAIWFVRKNLVVVRQHPFV